MNKKERREVEERIELLEQSIAANSRRIALLSSQIQGLLLENKSMEGGLIELRRFSKEGREGGETA